MIRMIYSNTEETEVKIGGRLFKRNDDAPIQINPKELVQTLSQNTQGILVLLDTTRGERGNIRETFYYFTEDKE